MKSVAIVKQFTDAQEKTIFTDETFLQNNNFIKKLEALTGVYWYVLGAYETGKDRLTPLSYISNLNDSFEFIKDDDSIVTIDYETFAKVYSKAEENLQIQYIVVEQQKIGFDYLINVYESGVF